MRIAIGVEYNGGGFQGWQRQNNTPTVQGCLESALAQVADHPVSLITAGRTDAGVHATCQVAHFDSDSERSEYAWKRGSNSKLPSQVSILWSVRVGDDFHARYSARSRTYRYVLLNRKVRPAVWAGLTGWDYRPLALPPMREAAAVLVGNHDFSAFRAAGCQAKSPLRTVNRIDISQHDEWFCFDISADGFLQHMVRNIVGVLSAIGAGERPPLWAQQVLASRDRRAGGVTAVPDGLYLSAIEYPPHYQLPGPQPPVRFW